MQWYADNSELNGIWGAELPDILLFGGIAVRKEAIPSLMRTISQVKKRYSADPHYPIKYNFRDLRQWFDSRGLRALYRALLKDSQDWRARLVEESLACDYKIVIACANIFGKTANRIRRSKATVTRFCFADALMRVALLIRESSATTCDVILDWPEGNRHATYTDEYRSAYVNGCCHDYPLNKYYSGPLKDLGFTDSPLFTRMEDCNLLQFSDIVIGAAREFIDFCMDKKPIENFGVQLTKRLVPKYRGYPHRIVGRGISVSPPKGTLQKKIFKKMLELRQGVNN